MQYTVRAAARATGVSADRLRTWERRYGIPEPGRTTTGRRLYEDADLAVIRRMAALVDSGVSAQSAAIAVRTESPSAVATVDAVAPELPSAVRALLDTTERFDDLALLALLDEAEAARGLPAAIEEVALAALVEGGRRWEQGTFTVAQEHLLSEALRGWLGRHFAASAPAAADAPRVVVACPEDERHDLGALALATLLRHAGLRVTYLGADVPTATLVDLLGGTSFDAVCLSVTAGISLPVVRLALTSLLRVRGGLRLYLGGRALHRAPDEEAQSMPAVRLPASVVASAALIARQLQPEGTGVQAGA